jgi:ribonuclease BN (tRNA processing enzyme)
MRLTVIGCSGSFPGPDSPASCYLLEAEDAVRPWRIVLDLGSGALGPLQRLVDPRGIDAVVISHLHPDHFMDLCGLYVARRYHPTEGPAPLLPVHGPAGTAERLVQAYGAEAAEGMPGVYDVREITDDGLLRIGPFSITTRLVDHPVPAYGMRVEADGEVLTYSGDTDVCASLVDLATDADLLLAEASYQEGRDTARGIHLTGRRAGEVARNAGAHRLLLTHIPVWTDPAVVVAEARSVFAGEVTAATPGSVHPVRPAGRSWRRPPRESVRTR